MTKIYHLVLMLLLGTTVFAQNLVPNSGFDQMIGCPTALSMLDSTASWQNPTINGTPDFFHQCSSPFFAGVPVNGLGYQQPHGGESYAGIHRFQEGLIEYREYLEVGLVAPLVAGQCYYFEMYISLSNFSKYTSPDIAVLFSDTLLTGLLSTQMLNLSPQIVNPSNMIPDTAGWMLVNGTYTASGGENFICIGNFVNDAAIDTILINPFAIWPITYVYVDDVLLTTCTGIHLNALHNKVNIFPNPAFDLLNINTGTSTPVTMTIRDVSLKKLMGSAFTGSHSFDIRNLRPGVYLYEVCEQDGTCSYGKFIKR
jgi:hypothetical protein